MRNRCFIYLLIIIAGISILSCNKNSDQLPPLKQNPTVFTKHCYVDDKAIDIVFLQTKTASGDTVAMYFRSQASDTITNIKAVVELCNALPQNYDNCHSQPITGPLLLKPFDTAGYTILQVGQGLTLDSLHINAGILSYNNIVYPLSGRFKNNGVFFIKDTATEYPAVAKGYILGDGSTLLRLKWDTSYYNIEARIVRPGNQVISEISLYHNTTLIQYLQQETFKLGPTSALQTIYTSGDSLAFKFKGINKPIADSIQSVFINLLKN